MFAIAKKLAQAGVLSLNCRNAEYTLWHNRRHLFPLVDDKLTTKSLAQQAGMAVPPLYGVIEIEHQVRELRTMLKPYQDFVIKPAQGSGGDGIVVISGRRNERLRKVNGELITQEDLDRVFAGFKSLADQKKEVFDEDIVALIQKRKFTDEELNTYTLEKIQGTFESGTTPDATVTLKSRDGKVHTETSQGDGPIDAIYNAIDHITGMTCKLIDYQVMAKTRGKDAQGEVTVRVSHENREVLGKGTGVNTVEASAEAYINGLNKLLAGRQKET